MDYQQCSEHYLALCRRYHIPVCILNTAEPTAPAQRIQENDGAFVITLNTGRIASEQYEAYLSFNVRKILMPRLVLETERLILRRFRMEDAAAYFPACSDPKGCYLDCCSPFSAMDDAYEKLMERFAQQETRYTILQKDTNAVIGTVNLFLDNSRAVDTMEIGYAVNPQYQRQGFAYEAVSALLRLLQTELGLDMVVAGILEENHASARLLDKLGFQKEGLHHKAIWHEGLNRPVDLLYYYRDRI